MWVGRAGIMDGRCGYRTPQPNPNKFFHEHHVSGLGP